MLPKAFLDLLFPKAEPLPTVLVDTYKTEVDDILTALNVSGRKVSDTTTISSLFYTCSHGAMTVGMSPRTYTESQLNDNKMDALKAFSALVKMFDSICVVDLNDKVVDIAKHLKEHRERTANVKELV
jgi:hypothetical protein